MRKISLIILLILLQSCETKKKYQFIDIVDEIDISGNTIRKENISIKEYENDSLAAVNIFRSFCVKKKLDIDYKSKNIKNYVITIDYKLLDNNGNIILVSKYVTEKLKNEIEKEIFKKENTFDEIHKNDEINLDSQFSNIDGHHKKLQEYIKSKLHDPSSYQHISTEYKEVNDHLEVLLTYRAKNSYNALVTNRVKAKCDLNTGDVLKIIE